jgi:hypothetical protein
MKKTVVTHQHPDFDACSSVWMVKKFIPGFNNADVEFVPAGKTLEGQIADYDDNVVHVDTGFGRFDHHHLEEKTSAAERIFKYLVEKKLLRSRDKEALSRLVELVTYIDNFQEIHLENPNADYHDMCLYELIEGLNLMEPDDYKVLEFALLGTEAFFVVLKQKIKAQSEIKLGKETKIAGYKTLIIETAVEQAVRTAQKQGFEIVVRKDKKTGRIRIKARPDSKANFKLAYEKVSQEDPEGTKNWYFHKSGKMLLNGSSKNPTIKPTTLTLEKVVEILRDSLR